MDQLTKAPSILNSLVGQKVTVYSCGGATDASDTGMLDNYDETFIRLRTDKGTFLYFTIARVRLIKQA